jgi:hypothetical protein
MGAAMARRSVCDHGLGRTIAARAIAIASAALLFALGCSSETRGLEDAGKAIDVGAAFDAAAPMDATPIDATSAADARALDAMSAVDAACAPECTVDWQLYGPRPPVIGPIVFDDAHRQLVLSAWLSNAVWVMPIDGPQAKVWRLLDVPPPLPSPRLGQVAGYDPRRGELLLLGWLEDAMPSAAEVWALTLGRSPRWRRIEVEGPAPPERWGPSMIYDSVQDQFIVFGGFVRAADACSNDTWALELGQMPAWHEVATRDDPPPGRCSPAAIFDPRAEQLIMFGGSSLTTPYGDAWALSLSGAPEWKALNSIAGSPPPAGSAAGVHVPVGGGRMIMVAGQHELWSLALTGTLAWMKLGASNGAAAWLAYDASGDRLFARSSTATYEIALSPPFSWSELNALDVRVPVEQTVFSSPMTYDEANDRVFVAGRVPGNPPGLVLRALSLANPDLGWVAKSSSTAFFFDGSSMRFDPWSGRILFITGESGAQAEVVAVDPDRGTDWRRITTPGSAPATRSEAANVVDLHRHRILVFAGSAASGLRNDVWALALDEPLAWRPIVPLGSPPAPRFAPHAAIDTRRDRLIVVSGEQEGRVVLQDVWALSLTGTVAWTELHPTNAPRFVRPPAVVYAPEHDAIVAWIASPDGCGEPADLWLLPLDALRWRPVTTRGLRPLFFPGADELLATRRGLMLWAPDLAEPLPWRVDLSAITCGGP